MAQTFHIPTTQAPNAVTVYAMDGFCVEKGSPLVDEAVVLRAGETQTLPPGTKVSLVHGEGTLDVYARSDISVIGPAVFSYQKKPLPSLWQRIEFHLKSNSDNALHILMGHFSIIGFTLAALCIFRPDVGDPPHWLVPFAFGTITGIFAFKPEKVGPVVRHTSFNIEQALKMVPGMTAEDLVAAP